jgi:hypothetical protein
LSRTEIHWSCVDKKCFDAIDADEDVIFDEEDEEEDEGYLFTGQGIVKNISTCIHILLNIV